MPSEDRLYAVVVITVVLFLGAVFTLMYLDNKSRNEERRRTEVACIQSGGELGEHNGWPTCTHQQRET